MKKSVFEKSLHVPVPVDRLWDWHCRPGAFERLAPAWQKITLSGEHSALEDGNEVCFHLHQGPLRLKWRARLGPVEPPRRFVDTQVEGPFAYWRHVHEMFGEGESRSQLVDTVTYALPAGLGGVPPFKQLARKEIGRLFAFRHHRMASDLERHSGELPGRGKRVLVSGSTGLIGRRLVPYLRTLGYEVRGLTRGKAAGRLYQWDPSSGSVDPEAFQDVDAVIHLAGENIASGRWTKKRRQRIMESRVNGTRILVDAMANARKRPEVFISASGANFYGSGPGRKTEEMPAGDGFLAEVCQRWEEEAFKARNHGIRTLCVRTGIVLDPLGGALSKMLPVFKLGLGGRVGDGRQAFPWIAMDDLLDIYERAIRDAKLQGPVNAVHPERTDQAGFSRALASTLGRPSFMPLPAFAVRAVLGQMGEETLLADLPVEPAFLEAEDHSFRFDSLKAALSFMLGAAQL